MCYLSATQRFLERTEVSIQMQLFFLWRGGERLRELTPRNNQISCISVIKTRLVLKICLFFLQLQFTEFLDFKSFHGVQIFMFRSFLIMFLASYLISTTRKLYLSWRFQHFSCLALIGGDLKIKTSWIRLTTSCQSLLSLLTLHHLQICSSLELN